MNQRNIFTGISLVLILQGIAFFFTKNQIAASSFPSIDSAGSLAISQMIEVFAALSILVGMVAYAARDLPQVVWAFTLGFLLFLIITMKHYFVDQINVPMFAIVIQGLIFISCAYLWMQTRKEMAMSV